MKYDYLIVGSGLYGAIFAHEAKEKGKKVLVVDKRPNIGGNIYTEKIEDISHEYSSEWKPGDEPYYPVNDEKNGKLYEQYKVLAEEEERVVFGGQFGEYKYYDMDQVIAQAFLVSRRELG